MYCMWRRRNYIHSGRLFARRKAWRAALQDIGRLSPEEMYETVEILGKGAGLKEVFTHSDVPERVKKAMRHLLPVHV